MKSEQNIEYLKSRITRLEKSLSDSLKENKRLRKALNSIDHENVNVTSLLSASQDITEKKLQALELDEVNHSLKERMKELRCLYKLSRLIEKHDKIENILADFAKVFQKSFQHPERTAVRITIGNQEFESGHFTETDAILSSSILCENVSAGKLDVAVRAEAFSQEGDPFLKEEKDLMGVVSERLGHIIERLRRKENYSALFDTLNEAILKADAEGFITEANSAAAELCGYNTPQELIGTHMEKLYAYPETREAIVRKLSSEGGSFHNFNLPLKRQDGTIVETLCNIRLLRNHSGEISATLGALRDVTDIKQAERELRGSHEIAIESREKYKRIFDNETIMIMEVDADNFEVVTCNEAMAKNLRQSSEKLVGKNIKDFLPENVLLERVAIGEKILKENKPYTFEDENSGKYFLNTFTPVYLGEKRYVQTLSFDITERKKVEMERDKLVRKLKATLDKVKILSGLLPICASCKKIRDDKGYWNHLESYISKNSEALFSHSICPECAQKLYPDFNLYEK